MVCEHQMQEQTLKSEQEKKAETMGNQWWQSITEDSGIPEGQHGEHVQETGTRRKA